MSLTPSFSDAFSSPFADSGSSGRSSDGRAVAPSMPWSQTGGAVSGKSSFDDQDSSEKSVDRRRTGEAMKSGRAGVERRQFGSTHAELSDDGRELASAIDAYKLEHHRRYITCDEMLSVMQTLGYSK